MTQERLSYAYGTSSQPLLGMTIGEKFDQACQQYAEQDAVVSLHQNVRLTYMELQAQVNAFACSLLKLGLKKGDRLAIWSPNCVEWTITQFAAFKAGIILVNLNPAYKSNELEYVMNQLHSKINIRSEDFKTNQTAMQSLVDDLKQKAEQIALGGGEAARQKHLARGKLLARDRIDQLIDAGTAFLEIGHGKVV
jgi:acyl-CoA synthetase (AMP-forming)/AMP-acid ligase II